MSEDLCRGLDNTTSLYLDVANASELDVAVSRVDIVVSLIPATHHVNVIKAAIRGKKNVVTSSYISSEMAALDSGTLTSRGLTRIG